MATTYPSSLTPSPVRLYPAAVASNNNQSSALALGSKSSADILDYTIDFTAALAGTGDSLASASLLAPNLGNVAYPLVSVWSQVSGTQVVLMLASGQPGNFVPFAVEVTTAQGRVIVQPLQLAITTASVATAPPATGTTLTVGGNAVTVGSSPVTITPGQGEIASAPLTTIESGDWLALSRDVDGVQTLYRVDGGKLGDTNQGTTGGPFLPLNPADPNNLPTIAAPSSSKFGASYAFNLSDAYSNAVQVGCVSASGVNWFAINSPSGHSAGLQITDFLGNIISLASHWSIDGARDVYTSWYAANAEYNEAGFRWVNKDKTNLFWKFSTPSTANGVQDLNLYAGTPDGSAWQSTPLLSCDPVANRVTLANEPQVLAYTAVAYANLPSSPVAWQRVVVTDRAIGGGATGVVAMWNPIVKAWTGLSGETLTP